MSFYPCDVSDWKGCNSIIVVEIYDKEALLSIHSSLIESWYKDLPVQLVGLTYYLFEWVHISLEDIVNHTYLLLYFQDSNYRNVE